MILGLQLEILLYVRSIRESNFQPYVSALAFFIKWLLAMDHYKYARGCSVHLFDLSNLEFIARSLYEEFNIGNFSFNNTMQNFSTPAPDQVGEETVRKQKDLVEQLIYWTNLIQLVSMNRELLVQNLYVC